MNKKQNKLYLAHVRELEKGQWLEHPLEEHLLAVAKQASRFAALFGSGDWAGLAGLWHDLGKYSIDFQGYIRKASGYEPDAHIETPGRVDHSSAGALYAIKEVGAIPGRVIAYLIAGHHSGLLDWSGDQAGRKALSQRLQKQSLLETTLAQLIPDNILKVDRPTSKPAKGADPALGSKQK